MIKKLRIKFVIVNMLIVTSLLLLLLTVTLRVLHSGVVKDEITMLYRAAENTERSSLMEKDVRDVIYIPYFTLERGVDGRLHSSWEGQFDYTDAELEDMYARVMTEQSPEGVLKDYGLRYVRAETMNGQRLAFGDMAGEQIATRHLRDVSLLLSGVAFTVFFVLSLFLSDWAVSPVEEMWNQRKQFMSDISHELKTPLAVIIANAELLQQPGFDEQQRKKFSGNILTMSQQMRHLVDNMLSLLRLDCMSERMGMEKLNLSGLVEECILPFEPLYYERGLSLVYEVEPGLRVYGNDRALRQCVDILLDNAQKYSEPGTVRLCLRSTGSHAELKVSNPTPEMSRSECIDVFKRFYRRDEARSSTGSYGLGLPIAAGIVERHDGKIGCAWEAGEICFTVTLPLLSNR